MCRASIRRISVRNARARARARNRTRDRAVSHLCRDSAGSSRRSGHGTDLRVAEPCGRMRVSWPDPPNPGNSLRVDATVWEIPRACGCGGHHCGARAGDARQGELGEPAAAARAECGGDAQARWAGLAAAGFAAAAGDGAAQRGPHRAAHARSGRAARGARADAEVPHSGERRGDDRGQDRARLGLRQLRQREREVRRERARRGAGGQRVQGHHRRGADRARRSERGDRAVLSRRKEPNFAGRADR